MGDQLTEDQKRDVEQIIGALVRSADRSTMVEKSAAVADCFPLIAAVPDREDRLSLFHFLLRKLGISEDKTVELAGFFSNVETVL